MTADSLLPSTAHGSRGRADGWGDAYLSADLTAEVRLDAPGARSGRPVHRDLGRSSVPSGAISSTSGRDRGSKPPGHALIASETPPGG